MKVTLKDIAKETGFSVSTISRTLRGKGKVREKNERVILEAAKQLGYPLQKNAGTKLKQEDLFVAIITDFHTGEFYASFFNGFINAGQSRNLDVSMFNTSPEVDNICDLIKRLRNSGYSSAVLMIPALHRDDYLQIMEETPSYFPLISCSNILQPVMNTVTFDAYSGASLVASHFKERGYQTVGFIEGPTNKPEARYRKNGFVDTINHNSDINFIWSYPGDYTPESGVRAFDKFSKLNEKPQAIFAANDTNALGFMNSARKCGYHSPEDIAIAGYDNLPHGKYHFPSLTSVDTNYEKLAHKVLDDLLDQLFTPTSHQGVVSLIPVGLKIRNSS
ncbi:MAG TPA: LacI family DNA-binding transcriptional regulator [Fodinibius sp.]|nr:LacI family DNA-binding transcriptional regulator [Fodinibius sp.]